jgi:LuxR family maltose regulon positive regulatory protein
MEPFLTEMVNQAGLAPAPFLLVLDDYHLVTAQSVHDALTFFLDHAPGSVHFVVATRADPPLPVARLRARGQLTDLRLADLRFTPGEAAQFLGQVMRLELSSDDVTALASRTEGWAAGLQMAALSLRGKDDVSQFVAAFTGSNRYILDYLLEEVLRRESERVQDFLLQTSMLERLCASLCSVVIGVSESANRRQDEAWSIRSFADSQAVLKHIEASNLFIVPLDSERCWYRYHRLFADLLRQRLHQMHPDRVPVLHCRASEWFEQNGLMAEAIDHALAAGDLERAANLIDKSAEATLMRGETATFMRWVDALPDEMICARPPLCTLFAWMLLMNGRPLAEVEAHLNEAEKGGESVIGSVTALRGLMAAFRGDMRATVDLSRRAIEQLSEDRDRFAYSFATWILYAAQIATGQAAVDSRDLDDALRMVQRAGNVMVAIMAISNKAELQFRSGYLREAEATYRQVLDMALDNQGQQMPVAGHALIGLGELYYDLGELDSAVRYLEQGVELTKQWSEVGPFDAYMTLARVRLSQGDVDGAWEAIHGAEEIAARFDATEIDDLSVDMVRARLSVALGDFRAVQRWAKARDLYKYIETPLQEKDGDSIEHRLHKYELLVLARMLIAQGRADEALSALAPLVALAERRGRPGLLIGIHILQALAAQVTGDLDQALAALERALAIAEPAGYVQLFVDEGERAAELLQEAVKRGIGAGYARKLLAAFPDFGSPAVERVPEELAEGLSQRELEVLRLLDTHLSSTEIAERLCISANTVRFHIKNIYGKLGVHSRSDAVRRAVELGLL